jgi:protein NrfD
MLEITSTRHNALIDPHLAVWSWEIPLYLFVGGIVAGMMVLGGLALLRTAKGDDTRSFFSMHTPLLGFILMNIGMLALLLDLTHRLYVWRIFTTFQYLSPMAWGSWVLIIVYGVLLVSALIRLPDAWPWLGRMVPQLRTLSDTLVAKPQWLARWAGPTWCWAWAWASTPASCSTPWWRGRCGTAPSSAPCSWCRACRPARR